MVDCVASFACEEMHMDAWGVDCIIAGSQKGLMVRLWTEVTGLALIKKK